MRMSDAGRAALTERGEGKKNRAYPDPGTGGKPWTIGYGHTGPEVVPGLVWTDEQCDEALEDDLEWAEEAVERDAEIELTQHEFDALVDFTINAGAGALHTSTLLKMLNAGDLAGAAKQFERWTHAGGKVMQGLLNRRIAEENWFNTPDEA